MFPRRNWKLLFLTYRTRLLNLLLSLVRFFRNVFRRSFHRFQNYFQQKKSPAIVLVVLLVLLVVTIKLILPSPQIFEGYLTVQKMSLTSAQENQTLLKNI
ncbi:hypothetical protein DP113_05930 [Brasilonema octagenarum UFV-E1]|jgi:ABC-type sulfate transport system permease subunit|uniref:Uncharacterized protein n=2 Tax=Brasilonema TaxID=383614 RepID=A0A856M8L2_9CYAN|nr:hypothetical protein [Brasilonema octagenarum UFV-OR1]QDL07505.1 hypothetical protein DP114_05975 [Brasilonema sennae CENA114]QDL13867.1 hypothetical protein DP113_05930 [Brasilonema octagenarum UFV-E1]